MPCRSSAPPNATYLKEGFLARSRSEELPCVDLELNVLMSIEDVTERVNEAVQTRDVSGGRLSGPARRDGHD
jgi:hypothetical protein